MFYVAPLLLRWRSARGSSAGCRARARVGRAAVLAAALVGVVPYSGLINGNATSDTLALLPLWYAAGHASSTLDQVRSVVVAAGRSRCGARSCSCPRRYALVLPALVLASSRCALADRGERRTAASTHASLGALYGGIDARPRLDRRAARPGRRRRLPLDWHEIDSSPSGRTSSSTARVGPSTTSARPTPRRSLETPVHDRSAHRATCAATGIAEPLRAHHTSLRLDGQASPRTTPTRSSRSTAVDGAAPRASATTGLYPRPLVGPGRVTYTALRLPRRHRSTSRSAATRALFQRAQTVARRAGCTSRARPAIRRGR